MKIKMRLQKYFYSSLCTATAERMPLNRAPPMIKLTQVSNTGTETLDFLVFCC